MSVYVQQRILTQALRKLPGYISVCVQPEHPLPLCVQFADYANLADVRGAMQKTRIPSRIEIMPSCQPPLAKALSMALLEHSL